jgi:2-oxoglutarate ferredoxin oxidoreductase subunit alpha
LSEQGIKTDYLRLRAIPFSKEVADFVHAHQRIYVVEMNRDGQLHQLLTLEFPSQSEKIISLAHLDGLPVTAKWVQEGIQAKEVK